MPIYVASQLAPKGGAKWPVLEDVYIKGGLRVVTNLAARDLLYTNTSLRQGLKVGMIVICSDTFTWWQYIATNTWKDVTPSGQSAATSSNMFVHSQSTASTTWEINHNMNSRHFTYTLFDASGKEISPDSCNILDENNLSLSFQAAQAGEATFAFKL